MSNKDTGPWWVYLAHSHGFLSFPRTRKSRGVAAWLVSPFDHSRRLRGGKADAAIPQHSGGLPNNHTPPNPAPPEQSAQPHNTSTPPPQTRARCGQPSHSQYSFSPIPSRLPRARLHQRAGAIVLCFYSLSFWHPLSCTPSMGIFLYSEPQNNVVLHRPVQR